MEIKDIVSAQREYFASGVTKVIDLRIAALRRLRRTIQRKEDQILLALQEDLGKSRTEAYMAEIGLVLEEIAYAEKNLQSWARPTGQRTSLAQFPGRCYSIYEPYGVVLIMSPWNYPFQLTLSPLVGALAAGNCCVLKSSNDSPATSRVIEEIVQEAFPAGYVTVVTGGRKENTLLLEQKFDYIFFTGGKTVGRIVMEKAAVHLTPVTLELGGKSPCIVDATADINLAAKRIVFGKFLNSGQTCVAPDYVLVQSSVKEELLERLRYWIQKMLGSNPMENRDYPRIVNQKHFNRLMGLLERENVAYGGQGNAATLKINPTLLVGVTAASPAMQEEIFGPILPIIPFTHLNQAERVIQDYPKPLALYLFTNNLRVEKRVLRNLSFGGGCINDTILHMVTPYMGFGGVGESGMGSYHGKRSFETFSHQKNVLKQSTLVDVPVRYQPYTRRKDRVIRWIYR